MTKIAAAKPEVIYVPGYYEEVGKICKQARELGITVPIIGGDGWDSPKLVEIAGASSLNNTYFTNHYSPDSTNEASKAFVRYLMLKLIKAKHDSLPAAAWLSDGMPCF